MLIWWKKFNDSSFILPLQAAGIVRKEKNKLETINNFVGEFDKNGDIFQKLEQGVKNRNQEKKLHDELFNKKLAQRTRKRDELTDLASVFKARRLLNYQGISPSVVLLN